MKKIQNHNLFDVSIIIPCRNEEKFISRCLDSLISQDYPKENLEILVVDGISEDKTRQIVRRYSKKYPFIKLLENPQMFTPFGLNIGIREARGEVIIRMDAHADYQKDYISKCLKYLKEYKADNVGGVIKTQPGENKITAKAIAISLSHLFGAASFFRLGSRKPRWVDTVFGGCYPREVFKRIGLFNENLKRSQDLDFNLRLKRSGGKILLIPSIKATYYPQTSIFRFLKHNFEDGIWITYPLKFGVKLFRLRHLTPLFFVSFLLLSFFLSFSSRIFFYLFWLIIFFYFLFNFLFSFQIALKKKDPRYLFLMPIVFIIRHFGYGLGSLWGLIRIIF